MWDLLTKPRAKRRRRRRSPRPSRHGLDPAKRQSTVEMNTSRVGWAAPSPTSSSNVTGNRDTGSRTPPSLYLIIVSQFRLTRNGMTSTDTSSSGYAACHTYLHPTSSSPSYYSSSVPHLSSCFADGFNADASGSRSSKPSNEEKSPRGGGNSSISD